MKIKILGSGTSTGVPEVGCTCPVCTSKDVRDSRLRTSAWICEDDTRILFDCGPDFRQQMLRLHDFHRINGVLITHEHYDHVGGLDDLRPFCRFGEIRFMQKHIRLKICVNVCLIVWWSMFIRECHAFI